MGFLPAHVSLTRILESSLQSVDPTVVVPYWEYTYDVETVINDHGVYVWSCVCDGMDFEVQDDPVFRIQC